MAQPPLFRTQTLSAREKAELWRAADTLRGHMDAAEYKHVVLGLIFLKYISDAFEAKHAELHDGGGENRRRLLTDEATGQQSGQPCPSPDQDPPQPCAERAAVVAEGAHQTAHAGEHTE